MPERRLGELSRPEWEWDIYRRSSQLFVQNMSFDLGLYFQPKYAWFNSS